MNPLNWLAQEELRLSNSQLLAWTCGVAVIVLCLTLYGFMAFVRWGARDEAKRQRKITQHRHSGDPPSEEEPAKRADSPEDR